MYEKIVRKVGFNDILQYYFRGSKSNFWVKKTILKDSFAFRALLSILAKPQIKD